MKTLLSLTLMAIFLLLSGISFAQEKAMHYTDLQKLFPASPAGFEKAEDPTGASMDMGGMSYSMAEQTYHKGDAELTIILFDYKESVMMLQQQTMAWNMEYEDPETIAKGYEYEGFRGWEVYHKEDREASVLLAVKDRYLVNINLSNQSGTDQAKSILEELDLDGLE